MKQAIKTTFYSTFGCDFIIYAIYKYYSQMRGIQKL